MDITLKRTELFPEIKKLSLVVASNYEKSHRYNWCLLYFKVYQFKRFFLISNIFKVCIACGVPAAEKSVMGRHQKPCFFFSQPHNSFVNFIPSPISWTV